MACSSVIAYLVLSCMFIGLSQATPTYRSLVGYRYEPEYCSDTLTGRQLYVGEMFTRPGQCVRVQCLGTLQLWEDSCKVPQSLKGECHVLPISEANLEYPKCCPLYECKTYESNAGREMKQTNTYDHVGNLRKSHVTELIVINKERPRPPPSIKVQTQPARKYQI